MKRRGRGVASQAVPLRPLAPARRGVRRAHVRTNLRALPTRSSGGAVAAPRAAAELSLIIIPLQVPAQVTAALLWGRLLLQQRLQMALWINDPEGWVAGQTRRLDFLLWPSRLSPRASLPSTSRGNVGIPCISHTQGAPHRLYYA